MISLQGKRVIISRTDSIGDVMLTLPLCAWIKSHFPDTTLLFLGRTYTKAVINAFDAIDGFVDWTEMEAMPKSLRIQKMRELEADVIFHVFPRREIAQLAKVAKIPLRIGTSHRNFHLLNCNHRVNFTRKRSEMHEAQLNFHLLRPFGVKVLPDWKELKGYTKGFGGAVGTLPNNLGEIQNRVVLHPKSQGSAVEWPMKNYLELAIKLVDLGYTPVFTGTEKEGELFRTELEGKVGIIDASGKLTLDELIALIAGSEAFVACSTGPLHIAGFLGIRAIGLFSPRKPIHPGRWMPIGERAIALVYDENCSVCKAGKPCDCITKISPEVVLDALTKL